MINGALDHVFHESVQEVGRARALRGLGQERLNARHALVTVMGDCIALHGVAGHDVKLTLWGWSTMQLACACIFGLRAAELSARLVCSHAESSSALEPANASDMSKTSCPVSE